MATDADYDTENGFERAKPERVFGVLCALPHFGDYYLH